MCGMQRIFIPRGFLVYFLSNHFKNYVCKYDLFVYACWKSNQGPCACKYSTIELYSPNLVQILIDRFHYQMETMVIGRIVWHLEHEKVSLLGPLLNKYD